MTARICFIIGLHLIGIAFVLTPIEGFTFDYLGGAFIGSSATLWITRPHSQKPHVKE